MSVTEKEARVSGAKADDPELLRVIKSGLQAIVDACGKSGFKLPLTVELRDADMSLLRAFVIAPGGKITLLQSEDENAVYVLPLAVLATDANGRTAAGKIDAERVEVPRFLQ